MKKYLTLHTLELILTIFSLFTPSLQLTVQNKAKWMEELMPYIKDKKLTDLTLPGTHDSGSYNMTKKLINEPTDLEILIESLRWLTPIPIYDIIDGWGKSQTHGFLTQMNNGIRYLDIRLCFVQGIHDGKAHWHIDHGPIVGNRIYVLLKDVKQFLEENPMEIIVLEIAHTSTNHAHDQKNIDHFNNMVNETIGEYLLDIPDSRQIDDFPTISEMVKTNKRVIITLNDSAFNSPQTKYWNEEYIQNSYANSPVIPTMMEYNTEMVQMYFKIIPAERAKRLFKMSWTLTTDTSTVVNALIPFSKTPKNLLELSEGGNKEFDGWHYERKEEMRKLENYPWFGNIFIIDNYETCDFIDLLIQDMYEAYSK